MKVPRYKGSLSSAAHLALLRVKDTGTCSYCGPLEMEQFDGPNPVSTNCYHSRRERRAWRGLSERSGSLVGVSGTLLVNLGGPQEGGLGQADQHLLAFRPCCPGLKPGTMSREEGQSEGRYKHFLLANVTSKIPECAI